VAKEVSDMPFGMGPAGWAYMYGNLYTGLPYPARGWWTGWRGLGPGRGRSFGWRRRWWLPPYVWTWAPVPGEEEIAVLEGQARILERELESVRKRLEDLKKQEVKNA